MKKKEINSFLLGIIITVNVFVILNLLQTLVIDKFINYVYDSSFSLPDSSDYNVMISTLSSNTYKISFITNMSYIIRELIVFIEVYYLIKFLGKKYYITILKLQNTLFTIFFMELLLLVYKMTQGVGLKISNIIYILFCLIVYFIFMNKFLVDEKDAQEVLKIRAHRRQKRRK